MQGLYFFPECSETCRNCSVLKRPVVVHTTLHGSVPSSMLGLICDRCNTITVFDGRDSVFFSWSESFVYSRELLDFWLYYLAMLGVTFRAACEISKTLCRAQLAVHSRLRVILPCYRREANDVSSEFLFSISYN